MKEAFIAGFYGCLGVWCGMAILGLLLLIIIIIVREKTDNLSRWDKL
jgi:hypothetical protein